MRTINRDNVRPKRLLYLGIIFVICASLGVVYYLLQSKPPTINTTTISDVGISGTIRTNGEESLVPTDSLKFQADANETIEYISKEIPAKEKANAAVLSWQQSDKGGVALEVRTKNGSTWSSWTPVDADDPGKDVKKADLSTALILAKNIDEMQYRFALSGTESEPSAEVDLSNSTIVTIDSSEGPKSSLATLGSKLLPTVSANAGSSPNIITRAQWGSPEPNWSSWPPEYAKLNRVILHHTATIETGDSYADVRAIWQYHARTLGWGDIGYHYIVDSHGRIFEGRFHDKNHSSRNKVEVIGGHAYGNNVGTVGISMIGNYQHQQPSGAALESMAHVTGYKLAPYGIDPNGNGPIGPATIGHFQVYATECPGTNIINRFGDIKARASEFYRHYGANIGFSPMVQPRWMRLSQDVRKINVDTGQPVDGIIPRGTDIKYIDKYERDGKSYLRTQHDSNSSIRKAIDITSIIDIDSERLPTPQWMTVVQDTYKVNPFTDTIDYSYTVPTGANVLFVDRITINGQGYFRTQRDSASSQPLFIKQLRLKNAEYEPFTMPRYLEVTQGVYKQNPFTGKQSEEVLPAGIYHFTSKIETDKVYFQAEDDRTNGSNLSIPADTTRPVEPVNLEKPFWMALSRNTQKLDISTLKPVSQLFDKNIFTSIKFAQKITINNKVYYRTEHDTSNSNPTVFDANDLMDMPFVNMSAPRTLTTRVDTDVIDPQTGESVGKLSKNTSLKYSSKIDVGDTTYLRSEQDTTANVRRAIKLTDLH